jgi:DNA transformation protein
MSADFIAHLRDLFAPLGPISARAMFGGHGIYHDGVIFGIVIDDALYLKTDDETRSQFEAAGAAPFVYLGQKRPITTSYWSLPEQAMDSPQAMLPWARLALAAALRKANAPKKRPARKPKP